MKFGTPALAPVEAGVGGAKSDRPTEKGGRDHGRAGSPIVTPKPKRPIWSLQYQGNRAVPLPSYKRERPSR
jgi:hypothetical protein